MARARVLSTPVVAAFAPATMSDWPLDATEVRHGEPRARGSLVWQSTDETRATGFWECTAGVFVRSYAWTETAYVVAGAATVESHDAELLLEPGALLVLPVGVTATWSVRERVLTAFNVAADTPLQLPTAAGPPAGRAHGVSPRAGQSGLPV